MSGTASAKVQGTIFDCMLVPLRVDRPATPDVDDVLIHHHRRRSWTTLKAGSGRNAESISSEGRAGLTAYIAIVADGL
jgi:hypothetical protein